jgi:hypothetical protein
MPEMYKLVDDLGGSVQTIGSTWRPSPYILCKIVSMVFELVAREKDASFLIISRAALNMAHVGPSRSRSGLSISSSNLFFLLTPFQILKSRFKDSLHW